MKRIILALLVAGTVSANAQENSWLVYGDLSFNSNKTEYNAPYGSPAGTPTNSIKLTNWNASPGIGYQFNDFWTAGLNLSWGQNATNDTGNKYTNNMYQVGPFIRYSHAIGKSNVFSWYTQFDLSYQGGYTTSGGSTSTNKYTGFSAYIFPAVAINVGHDFCLNFAVGGLSYGSITYSNSVNNSTGVPIPTNTTGINDVHSFNFNLFQQVTVGFSKNFTCKKRVHTHHEPGDEVHRRHMNADEDEDSSPKPKKKERNRDDDE